MATLFTLEMKQPEYPWLDEWINKTLYIHTMKYHSALRKKEILTQATTRMELKDIMLSEINPS